MSELHTFTAPIRVTSSNGAFVEVPFDVEVAFGSKRPKVTATIDGEPYRGLLVRMGGEHHILLVRKEIRDRIGKGAGDEVTVVVGADDAPRVVVVPDDLAAALHAAGLSGQFEALSYTHRKEWAAWVAGAKRVETRASRVERTVEGLRSGRKAP